MDCNFCGERIPAGTEYIHVSNKGKANYFCSSKCHKNLIVLDRKPRDVKWTKAYADEKEARLKSIGHKVSEEPKEAPKAEGEKKPPQKEHNVEAAPKHAKKEAAESEKAKKPKKPAKK
ncbi:MAG: hypothetical protein V1875_10515 [Candidatus Altiarchaeota archaeon]